MEKKNSISELLKSRKLDQRLLQCTKGEQWFTYLPKEFVEALGLKKGSQLTVILKENRIEIYPQEVFLTKSGMELGESA